MPDTINVTFIFDSSLTLAPEPIYATVDELRRRDAEVEVPEPPPGAALLPFVPLAIAAVITLAGLTQVVAWILDRYRLDQWVTFKDGQPQFTVGPSRGGRVFIVIDGKTAVQVVDVPPLLDFAALAKAVVAGGADAVKKAVEAAGGSASTVSLAGDAS